MAFPQRQVARMQTAQLRKAREELEACTFRPEIHDAPDYIKRIARSLAAARSAPTVWPLHMRILRARPTLPLIVFPSPSPLRGARAAAVHAHHQPRRGRGSDAMYFFNSSPRSSRCPCGLFFAFSEPSLRATMLAEGENSVTYAPSLKLDMAGCSVGQSMAEGGEGWAKRGGGYA